MLDNLELKIKIIKYIYKSKLERYAERLFIYNRVSSICYWPRITNSIFRYIKSYYIYKRFKIYREEKQGLLKSLLILNRY